MGLVRFDPLRGKATRKREIRSLFKKYGGKIPDDVMRSELRIMGYPHLYEMLGALGFWKDDEGNWRG
jgi:hypothetical protein